MSISWDEVPCGAQEDALARIVAAVRDDTLDDFMCVERIVCIMEECGIDAGGRHDF
nr:hypothetical protein [Maliibacterium massiliense]